MHKESRNHPKFDQRAVERIEQSLMSIKALFGKNLSEVCVFGSYAKGSFRKFSSIDMLIIINGSNERFLRRNAAVQRLLNEEDQIPQIDPLVYTEEEIMDLIEKKESFILSVLKEAIVVWNEFDRINISKITNEHKVSSRYRDNAPELEEVEY